MLRSFYFLFLSLMLTACFSCNNEKKQEDSSPPVRYPFIDWETCNQSVNSHPCNFELINQHGDTVSLYDYYGKVIVIDLSVMWCGPCRNMSIVSESIVADYDGDVVWLTLIIENEYGEPPTSEDLQRWVDSTAVTSDVLAASRDIIDNVEPYSLGYPVSGWPTFSVIDTGLVLRYTTQGWSEQLVRYQIDSLLE